MENLLELKNITLKFGGLVAVSDVSFQVKTGEILSVIGPNGAGKTSLFNIISGLYKASSGSINFCGKPLALQTTLKQWMSWIISCLFFSVTMLLLLNSQELWSASISDVYVYQEKFDYWQSLSLAGQYLAGLHYSWTWLPLIICMTFSLLAVVSFEKANRSGPLVSARLGIARTFQNLRLMSSVTVLENVKVACRAFSPPKLFSAMLTLPRSRFHERKQEVRSRETLRVLELDKYAEDIAGSLPYGIQRRVEIARALASRPKLLLLDEPAAGLNPSESQRLLELIKQIAASGITVVLIEHDMSVVMNVSDRIVVLHHGQKIAEGTPGQVRQDPAVVSAYLGTEETDE